jgi:hypothetical protein
VYMPTVMQVGPYRLFFYSGERNEPRHVHIERDDNIPKFWLDPVRLQSSGGFSRIEIRKIRSIIENKQTELRASWNDFFRR